MAEARPSLCSMEKEKQDPLSVRIQQAILRHVHAHTHPYFSGLTHEKFIACSDYTAITVVRVPVYHRP